MRYVLGIQESLMTNFNISKYYFWLSGCPQYFNGSSGRVITSPGYPSEFAGDVDCQYTIHNNDSDKTISVQFLEFDVGVMSENCSSAQSYIEVSIIFYLLYASIFAWWCSLVFSQVNPKNKNGWSKQQKEQDKSSDIEQQPPFGDCKYRNTLSQKRGIQNSAEYKT